MPERRQSPAAVLVVTTVTSFLNALGGSAVTVALPSIGRDLRCDAVTLNWIVTAFLLTSAMTLVPMGRIADIVGRKRVFAAGIGVFIITGLVSALANSAPVLVAARAVQGVGGAMLFATSIAIAVSVYPKSDRGRVIGLNTAAVYIGLSVGPFLGGVLTHAFGWRSTFWINVVTGPVLLALVGLKLPGEWREAHGERFDLVGSALYAGALAAVLLGVSRLPGPLGLALTGGGLAGLVAFVRLEARSTHPVLDVRLFRENRAYGLSNLAAMVSYSATFAVAFFLSLYLQSVKGLDARAAGFAMVVQPVLQAALSPVAGRLSDRIEPRLLASAGMGVTSVGLAMLMLLEAGTSLVYVEVALALLGVGFALFSSPNMNAIMGAVGPRQLGVANATLATMRVVGQMLSMAFALLLLSVLVGRVQLDEASAGAFLHAVRVCFGVFAVLCAAGVFASLARGTVHGPPAAAAPPSHPAA